jgi:hypothetical protein
MGSIFGCSEDGSRNIGDDWSNAQWRFIEPTWFRRCTVNTQSAAQRLGYGFLEEIDRLGPLLRGPAWRREEHNSTTSPLRENLLVPLTFSVLNLGLLAPLRELTGDMTATLRNQSYQPSHVHSSNDL